MATKFKIVIFVLVFYFAQLIKSEGESAPSSSVKTDSFGYEVLLTKMDYLEYKFMELDYEVKEQNEQIMQNQDRLEKTHEGLSWMMTRMDQAIGHNFTTILDQSWQILQQQKICSNHDAMRKAIFNLNPIKGPGSNVSTLYEWQHRSLRGPFQSCKSVPSKTSGKYLLQPFPKEQSFVGYCEQTRFGGGWLVIQRRYDGSVNFYRKWTEYKDGFGQVDKEFWIGLELLHKLTKGKTYHLLVELEDYTGDHKYARYAGFEIGSEAEKYYLKTLGSYTGTAGNALSYSKGLNFSTMDNDNDGYSTNYASTYNGGWWYDASIYTNLNGEYASGSNAKHNTWYNFKSTYDGLQYSRMMIREA